MSDATRPDVAAVKRALRRQMRHRRLVIAGSEPSQRICEALIGLVDPASTTLVAVYDAVPGEPDLASFVDWCAATNITTVAPDPSPMAHHPVDASAVDIFVVPGLAFTAAGHRLGQGGGWYDRFLEHRRVGCPIVGVAYDEQLLDQLPTAPHDVAMDIVVTDRRTIYPSC